MANTQSPLVDLQADQKTAVYIGTLERQIVMLTIRDAKFRALLELLTDETWDDVAVDRMDNDALIDVATAAVAVKLNINTNEAKEIVEQRWAAHNESTAIPEQQQVKITAKEMYEQWKARRSGNDGTKTE